MSEPRDPEETQPTWQPYEPPATPREEPATDPTAEQSWPQPWPPTPSAGPTPPSQAAQSGFPPPPGWYQQGYPQPGYPQPGYGLHPGMLGYQQQHGGATTSMTLGIISLVAVALSPFLCCVTLPAALTGPFGIVMGSKAQRAIDAEPGRYGNRSQATAGIVTGAIGTALGLALVVLLLFVFSAGSLYED